MPSTPDLSPKKRERPARRRRPPDPPETQVYANYAGLLWTFATAVGTDAGYLTSMVEDAAAIGPLPTARPEDAERDDEIEDRYLAGQQVSYVAKIVRVDTETVIDALRARSISPRRHMGRQTLTPEERELRNKKILAAFDAGQPRREIAEEHGLSEGGMYKILSAARPKKTA